MSPGRIDTLWQRIALVIQAPTPITFLRGLFTCQPRRPGTAEFCKAKPIPKSDTSPERAVGPQGAGSHSSLFDTFRCSRSTGPGARIFKTNPKPNQTPQARRSDRASPKSDTSNA